MTNVFLKVNKDLFRAKLNPTEILILAQIIEYQTNTNKCYITDAQMSEDFGISTKTVSRALDRLEELGFITRHTTTVASKRVRTLIFNQSIFEEKIRDGQNDCLNVKQTICPSETDNLSKSNGQNDFIKDKKENKKDNNDNNFSPVESEELGSNCNPIEVEKEWLAARYNEIFPCANGLWKYGNKFYKIK